MVSFGDLLLSCCTLFVVGGGILTVEVQIGQEGYVYVDELRANRVRVVAV